MLWKECSAMVERLRFVARLLEGEAMSDLAREFGISRKTGDKILNRYKQHGLEALSTSTRGISVAALAPTQSVRVETSSSTPSLA
jgi:transposase